MIRENRKKGSWECFHCGASHPNSLLVCECGNTKLHSENMRDTLNIGEHGRGKRIKERTLSNTKHVEASYARACVHLERAILKAFELGEACNAITFKDGLGYIGFESEEHVFSVRRKIK